MEPVRERLREPGALGSRIAFTAAACAIMPQALKEAAAFGQDDVDTEHLLLALIHDGDHAAAHTLDLLQVSPERIRQQIEQEAARGMATQDNRRGWLGPGLKRAIDFAYKEALERRESDLGPEHLLLGLIREESGLAGQVLRGMGVTSERARSAASAAAKRLTTGSDEGF